jgi:ADP-heptose:LPS heptosyltransferase
LVAKAGDGRVSLIVSEEVESLAAGIFPSVDIVPIAPGHAGWRKKAAGLLRLKEAIVAAGYDEVVCLRHYRTLYEQAILRALHAKRVVLFANRIAVGNGIRELAAANFAFVDGTAESSTRVANGIPREWSFHAEVLSEALGVPVTPESMRPDWNSLRLQKGAETNPFFLVSPLAGRGIRDLPTHLVQAAVRQAAELGLRRLVLTGTPRQAARLQSYAVAIEAMRADCHIDIAHPADLPTLVQLVAGAALVLTAETSTAHIAAALNQSAVVLIGGGHFGWFAPWSRSRKQIWLTNNLPCFDCNWKCHYPEPLCLTGIADSQVEGAVQAALSARG